VAAILAGAAAVTAVLWKWFVRLHTRLQLALIETMQAHGGPR
jgi:CPA2 family monovalent cation:H+ antiporter-2